MLRIFFSRQIVRMTWGNEKYLKQINASLLFVTGRYPNLKIQWRLEQEAEKCDHKNLENFIHCYDPRYKDILQGDFYEDYFLLALKSLTWLHWTRLHCSGDLTHQQDQSEDSIVRDSLDLQD